MVYYMGEGITEHYLGCFLHCSFCFPPTPPDRPSTIQSNRPPSQATPVTRFWVTTFWGGGGAPDFASPLIKLKCLSCMNRIMFEGAVNHSDKTYRGVVCLVHNIYIFAFFLENVGVRLQRQFQNHINVNRAMSNSLTLPKVEVTPWAPNC